MKKGLKRIVTTALAAVLMFVQLPMVESKAASQIELSGKAHVQTYGDTNGKIVKEEGIETLVLGTRGQAKRVESITVNMQNNTGYAGTVQYRVHRQTYGWTQWLIAGQPAGTTGQGKRLEGIQMRLTGELAQHYDIRYQVHIQTYGDNQGWVYNGALAGTTGEAKRLEEVKIQIIPKNTATETPSVSYRVHRQTYGWERNWAKDGTVSGTTGESKRLEGISIDIKGTSYNGSVEYQTHVQSYGWMDWVADGDMSGTSGQAKRLEAIRIRLTGELAQNYDIYYRVHAQTFGWMGWAKNGDSAGTAGYGKRLEAIQILLVKKGAAAPGATIKGVTQTTSSSFNDATDSKNNTNSKVVELGTYSYSDLVANGVCPAGYCYGTTVRDYKVYDGTCWQLYIQVNFSGEKLPSDFTPSSYSLGKSFTSWVCYFLYQGTSGTGNYAQEKGIILN